MPRGGKQALKLLDAPHPWETFALDAGWEMELAQGPASRLDIAEADCCCHDVTGTPGQLPFDEQMMQISPNLV